MASPTNALENRLQALLEKAVRRGRFVRHGLSAVAAADRSWEWAGAHGILDRAGSPATVGARYPVASITKLYTAAVIMRLVEQRRLALDSRLTELLPPATTTGLHILAGIDHTAEITIENLLGHTSGLPDYYEEAPAGGTSAQARLLAGEDAPMPFEDVLTVVRKMTPHFPPQSPSDTGQKAHYADTNYQLLGAVIEAITGRALHVVFDDLLFEPLGLDSTSSYPHPPRGDTTPEPDAAIWSKNTVLRPEGALTHQQADGGIISTLTDQIRFMQALIGGEIFDDPGTWDRMQARFNRVFFPIDYGLGVMRYAPPRWMSPFFRIPPIVGHTGSTATWLFHCPEMDVVLAGAFDVAQPSLPFRFLPRILQALARNRP